MDHDESMEKPRTRKTPHFLQSVRGGLEQKQRNGILGECEHRLAGRGVDHWRH